MPEPVFKAANLQNKSVQRILRAAMTVWARAGYHGASLKDIAAEAGVSKSLLHYHFASKEHLLIELQADWCRGVAHGVRAKLGATAPSIDAAMAACDQVWDAMVTTREQLAFSIEVWRQSTAHPALRRRLEEFDRELAGLVAEGLVATLGPLAHELALPIDRVVALLSVALDGFAVRLFLTDDVAAVRRTFDDFLSLLIAALLPGAAGGSDDHKAR